MEGGDRVSPGIQTMLKGGSRVQREVTSTQRPSSVFAGVLSHDALSGLFYHIDLLFIHFGFNFVFLGDFYVCICLYVFLLISSSFLVLLLSLSPSPHCVFP